MEDASNFYHIVKIARSDLHTIVDTIDLGIQQVASISVQDDTVIYYAQYATPQKLDLFYWHLGSLVHLNTNSPITISLGIPIAPGLGNQDTRYGFIFRAPYFYFGNNGFGGFPVSIEKIGPVIC